MYARYREAKRLGRIRRSRNKSGSIPTDVSRFNRAQIEGIRAHISALRPNKRGSIVQMKADTLVEASSTVAIPEGIMSLTDNDVPNQPKNWAVLEECRLELKKKYPSQVDFIDELGPELLSLFQEHPEFVLLEDDG
jgi:hypothetical protein